MSKLFHGGNLVSRFLRERDANAAVEFAFIVPLMLTLFFGMVEFSSGYAAQRKVAIATRNLLGPGVAILRRHRYRPRQLQLDVQGDHVPFPPVA